MTEAPLPDDERLTRAPGRRAGVLWDGRYRLVRQLGRGGFGEVWLAIDTQRNDQRVALKIIFSHVVDEVPDFATRFTREILVLRGLRHAGVPQIFNDGRTAAGEFFYTMEFVAGETLGSWIKQARLGAEVTTVVAQVAEILRDCHQRGVVHRDLKPANLMLHADNDTTRVFVLDFGIAKVVQRGKDLADVPSLDSKVVIGTAAYMSPEQLRGDNPTPATDVFALGIVLHEVLLGERPQHGITDYELAAARLSGDVRVPPRAGLAEPTRQLLEGMLRLHPAQRPTMADVAGRLRSQGGPEVGKDARRWPRGALLAMAVIAVLGVLWWVFASRGNEPEPGPDNTRTQPAPFAAMKITVEQPAVGTTVGKRFRIKGRVTGGKTGQLALAGTTLDVATNGEFDQVAEWRGGDGDVDLLAEVSRDAPHRVWFDVTPPVVEIVAPTPNLCTASLAVQLEVRATDARSKVVKVTADATELQSDAEGKVFRGTVSLGEGRSTIQVIATDAMGNTSGPSTVEIICDQTPPALDVVLPKVIRSLIGKVSGMCVDANLARLEISGVEATVDPRSGAFDLRTTFKPDQEGVITVVAVAIDRADQRTSETFTARYDPLRFKITAPIDGATVTSGQTDIDVRGSGNAKFAEVTVNQQTATFDGFAFNKTVGLVTGRNTIIVAGKDTENGEYESVTLIVTREPAPMVPAGCEVVGIEKDAVGRAKTIRHLASQEQLVLVPHGNPPFYIGKYEVTAEHYEPFCTKTRRAKPSLDKPRHPITGIKIADAEEFCALFGLRLPTAAEWTLAASGPPPGRAYPWIGPFDPKRCNYGDPRRGTTAAGDYTGDVTPEGAYDLAGNVQEYVASPDPSKPATLRGGAFSLNEAACQATATDSQKRDKTPNYVGFRVALDAQ